MAYNTRYQFEWNTDLEQPVIIYLRKKDSEPGDIVVYAVDGCDLEYNARDGRDSTIYGASVRLSINVNKDEDSPMGDFENIEKDTWEMEAVLNETFTLFKGFVDPTDSKEPFHDPPYSVEITATDQLGLIGDTALRNIDGKEFRGEYLVIEYLAAALQQTGQKLPIRVYDNVYHASHLDRNDDPKWDLMGQTKLEYRTFLADAVTFVSAREAIEIMLFPAYLIYQWNGQWVVFRKELLQYWPFAKYYTLYDTDGHNGVGHEETEDYATVGKNEMIYPTETPIRSLNFAVREAKSRFSYVVWPEIPKNNRFDLGDLIQSGTAHTEDLNHPLQGQYTAGQVIGTYELYSIEDWEHGTNSSGGLGKITLAASTKKVYRKIVKDIYLNILEDKIVFEAHSGNLYFQSEAVPMKAGKKISFSADYAIYDDIEPSDFDDALVYDVAFIYLVPKDSDIPYVLDNDGKWVQAERGPHFPGFRGPLYIEYLRGEDNRHWRTISVSSEAIPVDGTLYIAFEISPVGGIYTYIKDFNFSITSFVAGSNNNVKGDYWRHGQSGSLSDVIDHEVRLSDSVDKLFKGTLLDTDGEPLTADWHRHGITESKHFKQISNLSTYNFFYRRFAKVEGPFTGITYLPTNQQENVQPIALHKVYRMADEEGDRRYMITAPLRIDLYKGDIQAIFEEVYQADPAGVLKIESVARLVSRIKTAIDSTTAAEWGSGGFDPYTGDILPGGPDNRFNVVMPVGVTMDVSTTGATVTKTESEFLGFNIVTFVIKKYAVGDTITFSAWTGEVEITVEQVTTNSTDGQETGDYNDFKYQF